MSPEIIFILVQFYWAAMVSFLAIIATTQELNKENIAAAVLWPLLGVLMIFVLTYRAFVDGSQTIRTDLKNRGLLKEFGEFLEQREQSKVLPKEGE